MYLADTNVVSDAHRGSKRATGFLLSHDPAALFLSAVSIGEIRRGIVLLQRKNHGAAQDLSAWLDTLRSQFSGRILPVTDVVAFEWGRIAAIRTRSPLDAQIAATAMVHGLTLVTRNTVDFEDTGVELLNPWAEDEIRPA